MGTESFKKTSPMERRKVSDDRVYISDCARTEMNSAPAACGYPRRDDRSL